MVDWGSVPDWIAGAGTVLAVIVAVFALLAARKTNEHQSKQIAMLHEEKRREQASKIAIWLDWESASDYVIHVVNQSDLPVYNVFLRLVNKELKETTQLIWPALPPGTYKCFVSPQPRGRKSQMFLSTWFVDMNGVSWLRTFSELRQCGHNEANPPDDFTLDPRWRPNLVRQ